MSQIFTTKAAKDPKLRSVGIWSIRMDVQTFELHRPHPTGSPTRHCEELVHGFGREQ
ncbi:MAG: hypothetical protein IID08_06660 [Candidatus Hydrogenedentes bacterium]|nr:hypothetical protein [Candidatus Hydrogenedentota bacterium]